MTKTDKFLVLLAICTALISAGIAGCTPATDTAPETPETTGTFSETTQPVTTQTTTVPTTSALTVPSQQETFVPKIHPDTVGIYIPAADGTAARRRITEFTADRIAKTDIDCFEILASREDLLPGSSFASIWSDAWNNHENSQDSKIGFWIEFSLESGETVSQRILKPSDTLGFFNYLEIYMYDDIHQAPGVWYTHLEDNDVNDETIISSIKLTSGSEISQVGDIRLTAFIYQDDRCFDEDGYYIGQVSESILIKTP